MRVVGAACTRLERPNRLQVSSLLGYALRYMQLAIET